MPRIIGIEDEEIRGNDPHSNPYASIFIDSFGNIVSTFSAKSGEQNINFAPAAVTQWIKVASTGLSVVSLASNLLEMS